EPIGLACGVSPEVIETLHERRMGPLSGVRKDEGWDIYVEAMTHWKAGDLRFTHEGGESFEEMSTRVVPSFLELAKRHEGETIVVVAHGVVIRVLLTSILDDLGPHDFDRIGIEFVAVNDLRWDGTHWRSAGVLPVS
ncbi:histidine phosphatase family protein, partial [Singulisphaera rosea]